MAALALLRLFVIAVLIYLAFYLIWGRKKKRFSEMKSGQQDSVNDILTEDPVCHKLVPRGQALRLRHDGKTYYFCSEKCCEEFERKQQNPD